MRACDDESESEIKVVYSQTSKPSTKALAWESEGGEGLTKIKKREKFKLIIKKKKKKMCWLLVTLITTTPRADKSY